jgi:DNA-binding MarR family transcriptional regulator
MTKQTLSDNQLAALKYIRDRDGASPSVVGEYFGFPKGRSSSWGSRVLKTLVRKDMAERIEGQKGSVTYKITPIGERTLQEIEGDEDPSTEDRLLKAIRKFNEANLVDAQINHRDYSSRKELKAVFLDSVEQVPKGSEHLIPEIVIEVFNTLVDEEGSVSTHDLQQQEGAGSMAPSESEEREKKMTKEDIKRKNFCPSYGVAFDARFKDCKECKYKQDCKEKTSTKSGSKGRAFRPGSLSRHIWDEIVGAGDIGITRKELFDKLKYSPKMRKSSNLKDRIEKTIYTATQRGLIKKVGKKGKGDNVRIMAK